VIDAQLSGDGATDGDDPWGGMESGQAHDFEAAMQALELNHDAFNSDPADTAHLVLDGVDKSDW